MGLSLALLQASVACGENLPELWHGLTPGPYGVGVRVRQATDFTRSYGHAMNGVPVQLVLWYPAQPGHGAAKRLTQLDYEMMAAPGAPSASKRRTVAARSVNLAVSWLHVGIVPQTREQSMTALRATGLGVPDATSVRGRFPVVVIGNPAYLSTTAELLASHGYLVVSAIQFDSPWGERPPPARGATYEPDVRTQEWALGELTREPLADMRRVVALGHGAGGMLALLLAERDARVGAVVALDAAVFSSRSDWGDIPFAGRLALRVPMLNIVRQETVDDQDLYAEFRMMRYSERYEAVFEDAELRHHDLSNVGRGVSAALKIRGPAQAMVLDRYTSTHRMVLAFLDRFIGGHLASPLQAQLAAVGHPARITVLPATIPALSVDEAVESFSGRSDQDAISVLKGQHTADPDSPTFEVESFVEMAERLTHLGRTMAAIELLELAEELYPGSSQITAAAENAKQATAQ